MAAETPYIPTSYLPYSEKLHYVDSNYKQSLPFLVDQEELAAQIDVTFSKYDLLGRTWTRIHHELKQISQPSKKIFTLPMTAGAFKSLGSLQLLHYLEYINNINAVRGNYPLSKDRIKLLEETVGPNIVNHIYSLMRVPITGQGGGGNAWAMLNPRYDTESAVNSVMKYTEKLGQEFVTFSQDITPIRGSDYMVGMGMVRNRYTQLTQPYLN